MRSASRRASAEEARPAPGVEEGGAPLDFGPWVDLYGAMWREGWKWMQTWQQECQRYWTTPLRMLGEGGRGGERLRRASDIPWVPRVDAAVIPLRRSTDPPGAEGTRISMRVPMPWSVTGAEVITISTLAGRGRADERREAAAEPDKPREARESPG